MIFQFQKRKNGKVAVSITVSDAVASCLLHGLTDFRESSETELGMGVVGYLQGVPVFCSPLLSGQAFLVAYKVDESGSPEHPSYMREIL